MLQDVLLRVAADSGYHPTQQRDALIKLLNQAAKEIYPKLECNKIFREVTLVVPRNKVVSIPSFIGDIRGTRAHTGDYPFDLRSLLTPRYVSGTWNYKYQNWRDLGDSPVHTYVGSINPLTIESAVIEATTISITGQTPKAARIQEDILLNGSPKVTINSFGPAIYRISCTTERTCNIIIKDVNGTEIAVLYNTDKQTRYKIIDVSEVFWAVDANPESTLIDVAYKIPLGELTEDTDGFPGGDDYDDAWYSMAMHLHYKPMQGKDIQAADAFKYAMLSLASVKGGTDDNTVQKISFGRNKFYDLIERGGYGTYIASCTREP